MPRWLSVLGVPPPPPPPPRQQALSLDQLTDPAWATVGWDSFTFTSGEVELGPDMVALIHTLGSGCEDQIDALTRLVHNSWRPVPGWTLTPEYVARRTDAISMITAVHTWAAMCVGATNAASPDPRDTMHRSKGFASSSLQDHMTPCPSIIEMSFTVWGRAVAILDKFLHSEVFVDGDRHRLLLCACACYVIAWKNHFATFELLLDQVYQCILEHYASKGSELGEEKLVYVRVLYSEDWILAHPGRTRAFKAQGDEPYHMKTKQGLSLECAERCVLRVCGWGVGMSTIPDAIDAILGVGVHTDPTMSRLRVLAYFNGMLTIHNTESMYSPNFFVLHSAYVAVCEAALTANVPIKYALPMAD
jgi:hypothetical protein